jgi:glycosyltransferase involved in cell wall biosynthesis
LTAAVVYLGRDTAMGEGRRVDSLLRIFDAAAIPTEAVPLLPQSRATWPDSARQLLSVLRGEAVPETLAWSLAQAKRRLATIDPDIVVFVTARTFHPALLGGRARPVLDFVDRLSVSYADRAGIAPALRLRLAYRALAVSARRFERREPGRARVATIAAGWSDASALGATWVPNVVVAPPAHPPTAPDRDVLFVGTLDFPPNITAIERLARVWPAVLADRPATTLVLAGARPTPAVRRIAGTHRWDVMADFADPTAVFARARVAVAPLQHASGIQNKVLDAAAHGVAQVISAAAAAGLGPDFPAVIAASDAELVLAITELLDDADRRRSLGEQARDHVLAEFAPARWASWARSLERS